MDKLRIMACFFCFVSLLLVIIALSTDYWIVDAADRHAGLWQLCDIQICVSHGKHILAFFHATRAFLLAGMIAGTVSFCALCTTFSHTHIGPVPTERIAESACFVAGICCMVAMSVFTGMYNFKFHLDGTWLGWSFVIGWASFPLFLVTGGLT